ncbi:hypothetical protein ASPBRDRAFT_195842 [Aspergillus brasiliensis CBS 101740]|uniref:Uncharacterized protein n=1 Tax=Aspergillus brasiliensis (strain CBS 101740 / IMI 381727 / IBT 21946) TaxID=767769 RepID=A0A1L9UJ91_ASPBC|nr:hypothetical protein ASPBRDRAFT_195842 [Aspergillus brasiliensis CBS 101740]
MSGKQRVTLASMWAFEDIGVEEVTDEIKKLTNQHDREFHYHKYDNVLEIKGSLEGGTSQIAKAVSSFIDSQENKDLLDMPRINQLDVSATMPIDEDPVASDSDKDDEKGLLALSDSSDQELIPNPAALVTKFWLSSTGGVGCFSDNRFEDFLSQIAAMTGTEACVVEGRGVQVIGKSAEDVEDALVKLTRIEKPLSSILNPGVANLNATPGNGRIRFRMQSYGSLNSAAPRRLLTDPGMNPSLELGQMFVTVAFPYDEETHGFREPKNITNPPRITEEPGRSRLWNDFVFQGIGKGDEFLALSTVDELARARAPATATSDSATHPYLTPEKAKQVDQWNRWVVEGTGVEKSIPTPDTEMQVVPHSEQSAAKASVPPTKRPPGIKQRRLITSNEVQPSSSRESAEPKLKNTVGQAAEAERDVSKPRKKWKMTYNTESGTTSQHVTADPVAEAQAPQAQATSTILETVPENKPRLPQGFDTTKYGLDKSAPQAMGSACDNVRGQHTYAPTRPMPEKKINRRKELVDVLGQVTTGATSIQPTISFYQPALVPSSLSCSRTADSPTPASKEAVSQSRCNNLDLAGLVFEASGIPLENSSTESMQEVTSLSNDRETSPSHDRDPLHSNERATSSGKSRDASVSGDRVAPLSNARSTSHSSEKVSEQINRLASLSMVYNESNEGESLIVDQAYKNAPTLRQAQGTLAQNKVTDIERSHGAVRQLDGEVVTRAFRRTMTQKAPNPSIKDKANSKSEAKAKKQKTLEAAWGILPKPAKKPSVDTSVSQYGSGSSRERIATPVSQEKEGQQIQDERDMDEDIKKLYEALKPSLEAAETFPGAITLEVQIGLVLIPLLPKSCCEQLITFSEWYKIFKPRTGLAAPTTKFMNKLTTSGADIDHLVDLRTSKAQGKRRLFEQEYDEYNVSYEFHCRTKSGQSLVLVIDEQGDHSLKKPVSSLGGVNLHFPLQTWDANISVNCVTDHGPEFASAAQHMVDHLWIPADKPLLHIFTRLPAGNTLAIDKVYMKRWTRHKFIRSDVSPLNEDTGKEPTRETETDGDLFLQVLEIQDLIVGASAAEETAVRARAMQSREMIRRGRLWYEVSLVSPAIESLLKSNVDLEVGERAEDWSSVDLLGRDAPLIAQDAPPSPVAMAIGTGGLGDLLRLTRLLVEKADGVGYFNEGVSVATKESVHSGALQIVPAPKGLEFDDIDSIKELGSACPQGPELEFW